MKKQLLSNRARIKTRVRETLSMTAVYGLLAVFGFVFVYPLIYIILVSFMPPEDMFNPSVRFLPSAFSLDNYALLFERINFFKSIGYSVFLAGTSAALQSFACGLMGFALSRYSFKLKKLYLLLILACFIIPSQVTMIPAYLGFSRLKLTGSPLAFFIPAILCQGFKSPIFILIFYSFFNSIPKALDEAGEIDGASPARIFFSILVPLALPAFTLSFLFSFVWYWNETYLTVIYIGNSAKTLLNQMGGVLSTLANEAIRDPLASKINVPVYMASAALCIAPLLALYIVMQRQFVESVDRAGITGE
ncbi:MAG: carbohydrate ABC transporter permease [Treponema sp.]|jgi:multiple sugar transport system permease protein|nr:carbohydrate ABC transporter permease [Treponema sp.]